MVKKMICKLLGMVLVPAGGFGVIIFSLASWFAITDHQDRDLAVRIIAIAFILLCDAASFAVTYIGWKCLFGFKKGRVMEPVTAPRQNTHHQNLRCPECGISLYAVSGKRVKCTYCGNKFSIDL